ncbi:MAG: outer membrane protein assembly factor BamD [Prevotellaceae bacterium]|jgi:outer membrane protein assembly factor BamD|nr:outer membrane protein assembly factor BamD [Prevotellaceae bacterium]
MKITRLFYFSLVVTLLSSCTGKFEKLLKSNDADQKYKAAMDYYNKKKYNKAISLFDNITLYYRGTPRDDSVNFYLAKSYFLDKDPYSAAHYFNTFRQTFPRSQFTEEATFLRCICLYETTYRPSLDPKPTTQALAAINEFNYLYAASEWKKELQPLYDELSSRMDEKNFSAAKLYYTIENYKAAFTALKTVLKDNPENRYREDILYLVMSSSYMIAKNSVSSKQKDRYQTVVDEYYNVISEYPNTKYRKEVDRMQQEALEFLEKK